MLMFTLAISCLTTSILPWLVDLTFQAPMQYCSLQHRTLLLSPVTSTTGCCFCFGSVCVYAAAAKSLQSCPTLWPQRRQPTRLSRSWASPGKNTGVGCHVLLQCMKVISKSEVTQSCPTLSDPMDCSLPGSPIHGIFQARGLEWGAIAFSMCVYLKWTGRKHQVLTPAYPHASKAVRKTVALSLAFYSLKKSSTA